MPVFKASTSILLKDAAEHMDDILTSIRAHDMDISPVSDGYIIKTPFGSSNLGCEKDSIEVSVIAHEETSFNRIKADLTGIIDFAVWDKELSINWLGDVVGSRTPPDLRILTVHSIHQLTPKIRRICFTGENLARFAVPDQLHCRLLFQDKPSEKNEWPELNDQGRVVWPESGPLSSRIYTIRNVDLERSVLTIDFVLHAGAAGPGISWIKQAEIGDVLGIIGPNAHGPRSASHYVLAGDETGLPAIARILEQLPASAKGTAIIEIDDPTEQMPLHKPAGIQVKWIERNGAAAGTTSLLIDNLRALELDNFEEDTFFWIGAEYKAFRAMRNYLLKEIKVSAENIVAFSHWRLGMSEKDIIEAGPSAIKA